MIATLRQDSRQAIRVLRNGPGFTAGVMLKTLPVSHPEELLKMTMGGERGSTGSAPEKWLRGSRPPDAVVEQDQPERRSDALAGEAVAAGPSDAFQQGMSSHLAKVIAELGEGLVNAENLVLPNVTGRANPLEERESR